MGYLAINMSGKVMNVYTLSGGNDVQVGRIYHKERFSCLGRIPYKGATEIQFLNSSGQYVTGYCWPDTNQANDWTNYRFSSGIYPCSGFMTDAPVGLYNSVGTFIKTIPVGSLVVLCNDGYTEIGSSNKDWMRIKHVVLPYASGLLSDVDYGAFVECKIRYNSTNTPVYGDWN
ncbi:hypothetical protein NNC19_16325 [Clostridium sp. SHJSY1]|uniref:hypothetical protein n=1 Tax=Clostridium sp. SHJSY1 TaxID=2942483 RepID=UPI00287530D7|nr:hypothetical protein [Clostridium sp. SHJSY1]MDS0527258.1 hypothetical protein [Clostridium sp. SHJSY1]